MQKQNNYQDRNFKFTKVFGIRGPKSLYIYSIIIGIVSGLGAYLFAFLLAKAEYYTFGTLVGWETSHPAGEIHFLHSEPLVFKRWLFFALPIVGGLLTGAIVYFFCREAEGTGTDAMIKAFHYEEGRMNTKVPIFKSISTIVTLATAGSAGKEGPTAQIGAGFGAVISRLLGVGARARRTFLLAGTAGGLGAIFRAPLGGAITAVEVIYREDFESDSLIPCIISSVTAYLVFTSIAGPGSIFQVGSVDLKDYRELFFYIILGLLCFGVGYIFVKTFNFIQQIFQKLPLHPILKPGIGGLVVGTFGLFFPQVVGSGFGILQDTIVGKGFVGDSSLLDVAFFFLLIAFLKIVTTSFTIGSGGSGGVFGPSLFIGGMLGGFVGTMAKYWFPELNVSVSPFILVGMASFFAGIASAPIAGMIMVCDMIGSYALLPPLMIVSVLAFVLSHRWSIYKGQVENRFKSPAHEWDMNQDAMERIKISKYFTEFRKYAIAKGGTRLSEVEEVALEIQASDFIIVDEQQNYLGAASLRRNRLNTELEEDRKALKNLITIDDVLFTMPGVSGEQTLGEALRIILNHDVDKVAVLQRTKVIGYLRYIDILKAYHTEMRKYSR
ncbi:MAG: chloride channel protein [Spirochaetota bacterium]